MIPTVHGRYLFYIIISIIHLLTLKAQNITSPGINTLYVPIGQLHPRSDFAGVLINLNVANAIKRGKLALTLTNKFLQYHQHRQEIGEYSGRDRVIHFMTIKRNKVQQNLNILEADLHSVQEQFRLPNFPTTPSNGSTSRSKRGLDFDIKLDVNKCLSTIVQGVVSIFSSPKNLDKIQKSVSNLAYRTSSLESNFANFTDNIDIILLKMQSELKYYKNDNHMIVSINSALALADETIMELLSSITPLVQGKLTHNLLDPLQAQSLLDHTQQLADRLNLQVVVNRPVDILKCSVTTFATSTSWYALLSIPLADRSESMAAYKFMNIPWFYNGMSVQWDFRPGIVASESGLYPAINNVFIPQDDLDKTCERFNNNFLCHKRINHFPTCQISLMHNRTEGCSLKLADHKVRYSFGPFNYLFFQYPTRALVTCPNQQAIPNNYHGLIRMNKISKCKIETDTFTLLPKSTDTGVSSFTDNSKQIVVLDSDWIKVTVKFDNEKAITKSKDEEQNPWNRIQVLQDDNNAVKIFGSHTILVHSIAMFFIVTIMLLLLTICLLNFFDYMPEQFRKVPTTDTSSHSSVDATLVASPAV